jgi:ATP-dependent Clp protease ATP-binding subunit ClpC
VAIDSQIDTLTSIGPISVKWLNSIRQQLRKAAEDREAKALESITRFTPRRAKQVIALAQEEAVRLNRGSIDTEHILLGLIKLGEGCAFSVIKNCGFKLETMRKDLESSAGQTTLPPSSGSISKSPPFKNVLSLADQQRKAHRHTYLGTEHLLLV